MQWSWYYLVDIVVLSVLVVFTVLAARKGFINCMLGFIVTTIALLTAFIFADNLVEASGGIFGFEGGMADWLQDVLAKNELFRVDVSNEGLTASLENANVPSFLAKAIVEEFGHAEVPAGTTVAMLVAPKVSSFVCLLLCGGLLFLIIKLIGILIGKILNNKVQDMNVGRKLNILCGAIIGFIQAFLIISATLSVLSIFVTSGMTAFFDNTLFVGLWFNHNPMGTILGWIGF
jgi:hypothetical protein